VNTPEIASGDPRDFGTRYCEARFLESLRENRHLRDEKLAEALRRAAIEKALHTEAMREAVLQASLNGAFGPHVLANSPVP
jgi:hypothetical protein